MYNLPEKVAILFLREIFFGFTFFSVLRIFFIGTMAVGIT